MVSDFISVSNEAFAILIFENNYETWCNMLKQNITKKSTVVHKYTNGGSSTGKNGSSRWYQGWNPEGIKCFNVLFDLVKIDRLLARAKLFEEVFKVYCKNGGVYTVYLDSPSGIDLTTISFDQILKFRKDSTGLYFNFI